MVIDDPQAGPELIARREARSLALHVRVVTKVNADPELLQKARAVLDHWRSLARSGSDPTIEWRRILERPWPQIAALITDPGPEGARLRKSGPWSVLLPLEERQAIFDRFQNKRTSVEP
jgi:hypothetical protein